MFVRRAIVIPDITNYLSLTHPFLLVDPPVNALVIALG